MADRISADTEAVWEQFHRCVNMPSQEIRTWLLTVGSGEEAFPADPDLDLPELGREVVKVLGKRKVDLTDRDVETMRRVVGFVTGSLGSPPSEGAANDRWRRALMTVGQDPLKSG